jgi:hypothetical protein
MLFTLGKHVFETTFCCPKSPRGEILTHIFITPSLRLIDARPEVRTLIGGELFRRQNGASFLAPENHAILKKLRVFFKA